MLLIPSHKTFFMSLNTFLTAGSLGYPNPRGLVFVVLILSTLILCIYPDHVIIVNVTYFIPSKPQKTVKRVLLRFPSVLVVFRAFGQP